MTTSPITTHLLDTSSGRPASGVDVVLEYRQEDSWTELGRRSTNADGRVDDLLSSPSLQPGDYRLTFATGAYFSASGRDSFHPTITVHFLVDEATAHYHVPVLVSPFGFTTYRGS